MREKIAQLDIEAQSRVQDDLLSLDNNGIFCSVANDDDATDATVYDELMEADMHAE